MAASKEPEEAEVTPPSPTLLKKLESATIDAATKLLNMPKKPKAARVIRLTPEQEEQLASPEKAVMPSKTGRRSMSCCRS